MGVLPFSWGFPAVDGPGMALEGLFGQSYATPQALYVDKEAHGDPLIADTAINRHMLLAVAVNSAWARVFLSPK